MYVTDEISQPRGANVPVNIYLLSLSVMIPLLPPPLEPPMLCKELV